MSYSNYGRQYVENEDDRVFSSTPSYQNKFAAPTFTERVGYNNDHHTIFEDRQGNWFYNDPNPAKRGGRRKSRRSTRNRGHSKKHKRVHHSRRKHTRRHRHRHRHRR